MENEEDLASRLDRLEKIEDARKQIKQLISSLEKETDFKKQEEIKQTIFAYRCVLRDYGVEE